MSHGVQDFHGCSDYGMVNSYVAPQLSTLLIMQVGFPIGTASAWEVLPPPLLQVSQLPEKAIASQEEKVPSLELGSSHKIVLF